MIWRSAQLHFRITLQCGASVSVDHHVLYRCGKHSLLDILCGASYGWDGFLSKSVVRCEDTLIQLTLPCSTAVVLQGWPMS